MQRPALTPEGETIVDQLLQFTPAMMKKGREEKLMDILSLLMTAEGVKEAGRPGQLELSIGPGARLEERIGIGRGTKVPGSGARLQLPGGGSRY